MKDRATQLCPRYITRSLFVTKNRPHVHILPAEKTCRLSYSFIIFPLGIVTLTTRSKFFGIEKLNVT